MNRRLIQVHAILFTTVLIGYTLSQQKKQSMDDFAEFSEQQFEQKVLSQFDLQYKFSDDKQWKKFGQIQIIRNYKQMSEKIAIKQDVKLKTLREQLKSVISKENLYHLFQKQRLFFKIEKSCDDKEQSLVMNSIPTSYLLESNIRMSMNIAFTSNECQCIKGMSFKTSNKLRKGNLKNRVFLQTKTSIPTLVKSPTLTHKQYDMNGKFVKPKTTQQNEQPPQSFFQKYWLYILIGVVMFSMMNAGGQQAQQG